MALELEALEVGYVRGMNILNGLSLNLGAQEIVTIAGPNGSGKSTCLKTAAGFLKPNRGRIVLDGIAITEMAAHHRVRRMGLAVVTQSDNVFAPLTIIENLLLGGSFLKPKLRLERLEMLLALYPVLRYKAKHRAADLSGGERQMLALARALMPAPKYLLLDEPSAGLSPQLVEQVFGAIRDTCRTTGISVLLIEQNASEAFAISDRAYVLVQGRVALSGTIAEVMANGQIRELYLGGVCN